MGTRLLLGVAAGAGLMYFLDPQSGRRRRALLRDQLTRLQNRSSDRVDAFAETTLDHARGAAAETARQFSQADVSDETLVARVRSEMGRYVSHPGAVEVEANNGVVTLSGHILSTEVQPFVAKVRTMPNVKHVNNELQVHRSVEGVTDLQGGRTRPELR